MNNDTDGIVIAVLNRQQGGCSKGMPIRCSARRPSASPALQNARRRSDELEEMREQDSRLGHLLADAELGHAVGYRQGKIVARPSNAPR